MNWDNLQGPCRRLPPPPGEQNACRVCRKLFKRPLYVFIAGTAMGCCSQRCADLLRPPKVAAHG